MAERQASCFSKTRVVVSIISVLRSGRQGCLPTAAMVATRTPGGGSRELTTRKHLPLTVKRESEPNPTKSFQVAVFGPARRVTGSQDWRRSRGHFRNGPQAKPHSRGAPRKGWGRWISRSLPGSPGRLATTAGPIEPVTSICWRLASMPPATSHPIAIHKAKPSRSGRGLTANGPSDKTPEAHPASHIASLAFAGPKHVRPRPDLLGWAPPKLATAPIPLHLWPCQYFAESPACVEHKLIFRLYPTPEEKLSVERLKIKRISNL